MVLFVIRKNGKPTGDLTHEPAEIVRPQRDKTVRSGAAGEAALRSFKFRQVAATTGCYADGFLKQSRMHSKLPCWLVRLWTRT